VAEALLTVLEARSLTISDDHRATILGCHDRAQLEAWLTRAVQIREVDELFAPAR
jgi:hypothetical protein